MAPLLLEGMLTEPPAVERVGLATVPAGVVPALTPDRVGLPEGEGAPLPLPMVPALLADEGIPVLRVGLVVEREGLPKELPRLILEFEREGLL